MTVVFANKKTPIAPDRAVVHDNESFGVQWSAFNAGNADVPAFVDRFVITKVPEGCPGSDDVEHEVVFESEVHESELAAGTAGPEPRAALGSPGTSKALILWLSHRVQSSRRLEREAGRIVEVMCRRSPPGSLHLAWQALPGKRNQQRADASLHRTLL